MEILNPNILNKIERESMNGHHFTLCPLQLHYFAITPSSPPLFKRETEQERERERMTYLIHMLGPFPNFLAPWI